MSKGSPIPAPFCSTQGSTWKGQVKSPISQSFPERGPSAHLESTTQELGFSNSTHISVSLSIYLYILSFLFLSLDVRAFVIFNSHLHICSPVIFKWNLEDRE